MATRTWTSNSDTDMNDPNNYDGSGALLTTDDLVFDGTGNGVPLATANLSVNSVTYTSDQGTNWQMGGYDLQVVTGASFTGDGTDTLDLDGALTVTGDPDGTFLVCFPVLQVLTFWCRCAWCDIAGIAR